MKATTAPHTIWLIPSVFDRVWRDERRYVICEQFRGLSEGTVLLIEEGDEDGTRSGRNMRARVEALSPSGSEGLPRDVCVFEITVIEKRAAR